ncbi:MAG: hypothetical protein QNK05_18815 [Myxococcota bacterium]|nr:hypothetical protein [Myxococcota bacterium]
MSDVPHPPFAAAPVEVAGVEARATDLILRPDRFARHFVPTLSRGAVVAAVLLVGFVGTADQIDLRMMGLGSSLQGGAESLATSWPHYLGAVGFGAPIAGLMQYWLGGAWYALRLRFCGARGASGQNARRWNIVTGAVASIASVTWLALGMIRYETPAAYAQTDDLANLIPLGVVLWSVWLSYRGAHALFDIGRWSSRFWFLAVPFLFYSAIMVGAMASL